MHRHRRAYPSGRPEPLGGDRLRRGRRQGHPVRETVCPVSQGGRRHGRGLQSQRGEDRSRRPQHQPSGLPRGGKDDRGGEIGEVKSIHFFGGGGAELSGGGIQQFSLMRMFAGFAEVAWCIGWVDDDPWKDYDQGGSGYVRFVNGVEAFISRERDARGSGFQVNCDNGVFVSNADVLHMFRSPDGSSSWETMEEIDGLFPETNVIGKTSGHREQDGWLWPGDRNLASVSLFVDHLEQDLDPPGSGDNGRKVLEIAIGLRESHRRGHARPVPPRRQGPSHDPSLLAHELQEAPSWPRGVHAADGLSCGGRPREGVAAAFPVNYSKATKTHYALHSRSQLRTGEIQLGANVSCLTYGI